MVVSNIPMHGLDHPPRFVICRIHRPQTVPFITFKPSQDRCRVYRVKETMTTLSFQKPVCCCLNHPMLHLCPVKLMPFQSKNLIMSLPQTHIHNVRVVVTLWASTMAMRIQLTVWNKTCLPSNNNKRTNRRRVKNGLDHPPLNCLLHLAERPTNISHNCKCGHSTMQHLILVVHTPNPNCFKLSSCFL